MKITIEYHGEFYTVPLIDDHKVEFLLDGQMIVLLRKTIS